MRVCITTAVVILLLLLGCAHSDGPSSLLARFMDLVGVKVAAGDKERGKVIAQEKCAPCHALSAKVISPHVALSFPELAKRSALTTERLHQILSRLPHPMPAIELDRQAAEDLISYMRLSAIMP